MTQAYLLSVTELVLKALQLEGLSENVPGGILGHPRAGGLPLG